MRMKKIIPIVIIFVVIFLFLPLFIFFKNEIDKPDDIDKTITTARDITGGWTGIVSFSERVPQCSYSSDFNMNLLQTGNNVRGNFNVIIKKIQSGTDCLNIGTQLGFPVSGTVSSSAINLEISNTDKLLGSLTTDQMTLRWEICDNCNAGPAIKFNGPLFLTRVR